MPKQLQIKIPEPCHEGWNNMTPSEKGRFCGSCQKQVIDFTNMSDREIAQFFKKPITGSVCGHFRNTQLDRDIQVPKKRLPWVRHFFQITLPMFLLSFKPGASKAQINTTQTGKKPDSSGRVGASYDVTDGIIITSRRMPVKRGVVVNEKGEPLAGATVALKATGSGTVTDDKGQFQTYFPSNLDSVTLIVTYIGYELKEIKSPAYSEDPINITMIPFARMLDGEVVIVKTPARKRKEMLLVKNELFDTSGSEMNIFPNPVSSGSKVNIKFDEWEKGNYIISLLNQSGQTISSQKLSVENTKTQAIPFPIPVTSAGNYFIVVSNKKGGKKFAKQIIIQ